MEREIIRMTGLEFRAGEWQDDQCKGISMNFILLTITKFNTFIIVIRNF